MSTSKTEEPTPRRLREARQRGEVPRSRELIAAVSLFVGLAATLPLGRELVVKFPRFLEATLGSAPGAALRATLVFAPALATVLLSVALVSALTAFAQVGPLWSAKAISFDAKRIDPARGMKRLVTRDRFIDLARHLVALAVAGGVALSYVADVAPSAARLVRAAPGEALPAIGALLLGLSLRVGAALALFAVADFFLQRRRHRRSLRMSLDEVRREHREAEGDPHGKQARARVHRETVEHGVLEEVRRASVLVVNPTHYAVALRFDERSEQEAPEVTAKGVDALARRMIEAAREAGVPVVRDVPLARSLHELELGEEIPETFYRAVAAILEVAAREREAS